MIFQKLKNPRPHPKVLKYSASKFEINNFKFDFNIWSKLSIL